MLNTYNNSAVIIFDCWDKHWHGDESDLIYNCWKINKLIHKLRAKNYCIIHHPSDCTKNYNHNNNLQNVKSVQPKINDPFHELPNTKYLNNIMPKAPPLSSPEGKILRNVWTKQNKEIEIYDTDYLTEDLSELIHILTLNSIENLYYVGYHINACVLWTKPTSIGNLKQHVDINTYIIEDLSKCLLKTESILEATYHDITSKVYLICKNDYSTKLINSKEL